jgi:hypothetical protein
MLIVSAVREIGETKVTAEKRNNNKTFFKKHFVIHLNIFTFATQIVWNK